MPGSGTGTPSSDSNIALTIDALRYHLWDITTANNLINDQEYSNDMLIIARQNVIDKYNATPPYYRSYTAETFPAKFVYPWKCGAAAEALRMAARRYARNELPYSAGGVSINDQNKAAVYMQLAAEQDMVFLNWMHSYNLYETAMNSFMKLD